MAADLVAHAPAAPAVQAAAASWTGAYLGAQAGYIWGKGPSPDQGWEVDPHGFSLGAFAGYNYDLGGVVLGVEGGANWSNATGSVATGSGPETFKADQNWEASLVGRLGVPVSDTVLLYGLAGGSVTQLTGQYVETPPPNSPTATTTVGGWTAGLGTEFKLSEMLALRGEYRFASYGKANLTCSSCGTTSVNLTTSAVTAGLVAHW
jgi:outer membrane immunogenic protein